MASYATPKDLYERHDIRLIQDLCEDDGVRPSRPEMITNANVLTQLADASGAVESALIAGGRYTVEQLEGLEGNSLSLLKRVTCDIAMSYLYDRRPSLGADMLEKYWNIASRHLELLRTGENIFNFPETIEAGNPTIDGPSSVDYSKMNLLPDRTRRYYPSRGSRLPTDRR